MTFQLPANFNSIIFAQKFISSLGFVPVNFHFPGINPHSDSCISFGLKKFSGFKGMEEQILFYYDDGDMNAPNKGFLLTTKGMHLLGYPWFIPMERFMGSNLQLTRSQVGFDLTMYYAEGVTPASDTYKIYVPNDMLIPVLRKVFQQLGSDNPMEPLKQDMPEAPASAAAVSCPACNAPAREGQKFCTKCGSAIPAEETKVRLKKFCTNCGSKLLGGAKFCQNCGTKLYD
ncbi:hypothetical protein D081_1481 [Anaerovibrio sp. JC8]|uniref:zinc ribbon domain-containing protein n=1 Tax=Anaerovibrio sp. JC8 TaxID=1240085 RepID=UPI000A0CD533|nr:zinc ribbon domain-containing protein [Anaerovibrio sp. JC8]ORT99900.1 hypothetical protein D081_1481 [Anaerovibrio sp. JC8]